MGNRGNKSKDDLDDTHLHLEHLLGLLRRLELEGDLGRKKFFVATKKLILANLYREIFTQCSEQFELDMIIPEIGLLVSLSIGTSKLKQLLLSKMS